MNNVLSSHFPQAENDSLWEVKQDIFYRIFSQVDNIHQDSAIPATLKNISLYLETDADIDYHATEFDGISKTREYNLAIKEYVKYDDDNWVVFIDLFNRVEFNEDGEATDLNLENPYAQISKFAIGCVDSAVFIAPGGAERVIAISNDFKMKKLGLSIEKIKAYMNSKPLTDGYKVNEFDTGAYLLDSPAPLFANDSVEYRDGDYVGLWLSFGTLLKYDLRDLNVFNIDGVPVGGIDSDVSSKSVKILKMLTNTAYGYASMIFNKKTLLENLMKFSKSYIYDTNIQDETRICVDNILFNLSNTGILGLVYDEFDGVEEFPMFAYDETTVEVVRKRGTVIKFKYQNDYIYMMMDLEENKMYFMSYHGRVNDYYNSEFDYSVKIMNDLWVSKVNDISPENFILFTGFPNLQHNKVLDMYFDDTAESFSSLDKQFAIDVNEFDTFYDETVEDPTELSYDKRTDFMHAYGNNPIPLVSGLLSYEEVEPATPREQAKYELHTNASPDIKTFIDAESKTIFMFEPVVNANGHIRRNVSEVRIWEFINNYVARWKNGSDIKEWITEAEYGGYAWSLLLKYYSNGWTFYKHDEDTYKCVKLPTVRRSLSYEGSIVTDCLMEAEALIEEAQVIEGGDATDKLNEAILKRARHVVSNYNIEIKQIAMSFAMQIFTKMTLDTNIIDPESAVFEFKKFLGSEDMYVNNEPTGPFANHAILFDDTFDTIIANTPDLYDHMMSYSPESDSFYCPYISDFKTRKADDVLEITVESDLSTSRSIYRSKRAGIVMYKPNQNRSGDINVGGLTVSEDEAYSTYISLSYLGVRDIGGLDFNVARLSSKMKFSQEFIEALAPEMNARQATDWADYPGAMEQYQKETEGMTNVANLDLESGQPVYVAFQGTKLKVSLDGKNFLDAPVGGSDFELSSAVAIEDRTAFAKTLNTLLYQRKNGLEVPVSNTDTHVENDIYSVGITDIRIDTENIFSEGTVHVAVVFKVDNGQVVIDGTNFLYNDEETFIIEKTISVDGFKRVDPDEGDFGAIKALIPFNFIYHTLVPARNDTVFGTASELLLHDTAYKVKMNLPMFISVPANEYYYVDKDEAETDGVVSWFNFKGVQ